MSRQYVNTSTTTKSYSRNKSVNQGRTNEYNYSTPSQRVNASRTKSLPQDRNAINNDEEVEYDEDKPTVIRHKRFDEPVVRQWAQALRGELHEDTRPPFVLDSGDSADNKKGRQSYQASKAALALKQQKRDEEKVLLASWQGSLRGEQDETSWVTITPTDSKGRPIRNNRAASEKRNGNRDYSSGR